MKPQRVSGRDYEFREPTPGESEEPQATEPTDAAEARKDFWSIQGDFIYRHHAEPRVQRCALKEET